MHQDGGIIGEEREGFLESASCLEEHVCLIAEADVESEGVVRLDIVDDLLSEMVDVDDYLVYSD